MAHSSTRAFNPLRFVEGLSTAKFKQETIAEIAYILAQARDFVAGQVEDWTVAARELGS